MSQSDQELVELAKKGDTSAFAALVQRHEPKVRRLARSLVRDHAEADDLAQEGFLRAFQALPKFDGRSSFFTWIYRIILNLSLNQKRAKGVRRHVDADEPMVHDMLVAMNLDPVDAIEQKKLVLALIEELEALPDSLSAALKLVAIDHLPQDEIASIMGCPVGTIAWRVHEARRKIKLGLEQRGLLEMLENLLRERTRARIAS
jgi:RNA polymerase sigma-70 factor (ECF subfamily)